MRMMGMAMDGPWGARDVFFTFAMWAVMMVGMMSPSAAPVLMLFSGMHAGRSQRRVPVAVLLFGLGYLTVWLGFSACAALGQWGLHEAALLSPTMSVSSSQLAGAILIAAGAYQLTPLKGGCLAQCQSPLGFLMSKWRDGAVGAFRMGLRHGLYCLGCCWALMVVLLAVGVMNLVWVGALTVFVFIEKLGRGGVRVAQIAGVVFVAWGMVLLSRGMGAG